MQAVIQALAVTIKELRELLHRPVLVLTLILGPLVILIAFGMGSDVAPTPPRTIVVLPPGQEVPRLLQSYEQQFNQYLNVVEYTDDEAYAREQLREQDVEAVVILPPHPFETIASGEPATIRMLYNQIDPLWRNWVPYFMRTLAGEINREIFLSNLGENRQVLEESVEDLDVLLRRINQAIDAVNAEEWQGAREQVQSSLDATTRLATIMRILGPVAAPFQNPVEQARGQLEETDERLEDLERRAVAPRGEVGATFRDLLEVRETLQALRDAIASFTGIPPDVMIAPLNVETELVARLIPDVITFFAPTILALLMQHMAVSLGALALVRERLSGTFDLYSVAPISNLQLLLGKYVAYLLFALTVTGVLLGVLVGGLGVPVFGSLWRLMLTVLLLILASIGIGFACSLLAASERQAVQFSMLVLLGVVFFSGFILPMEMLRQPAVGIAYMLPATYAVLLLQDIMLRGLPGSNQLLLILAGIAVGLFAVCFLLLHWRTRAH